MSLNTTPATWVAGTVVTAAQLNLEVRDALTGIQAAWGAWSPAWTATTTNPTLNNGTLTGLFTRFGKTVMGGFVLTMGSTTLFGTGNYLFSVPATARGGIHTSMNSQAELFDTSAVAYNYYVAGLNSTTQVFLRAMTAGGALATNAAPYAWAVGDVIAAQLMYEAA